MRICMCVFLYLEGLALLLEHYADVHVQSRSVGRKGCIIGILHITSCPLSVSI